MSPFVSEPVWQVLEQLSAESGLDVFEVLGALASLAVQLHDGETLRGSCVAYVLSRRRGEVYRLISPQPELPF